MKKILAIGSALLMCACVFTGCGADKNNDPDGNSHFDSYDYGNGNSNATDDDHGSDNSDGDSASDRVHDAIDGVESAADDIIDGGGDAAHDIVDGVTGDESSDTSKTDTTASSTTER